jgi:hypothetical protein
MMPQLEYATPEKRRVPRKLVLGIVLGCVALPIGLPRAWSAVQQVLIDRQLNAEASRLRAANAPQQVWPTTAVIVTTEGYLLLPDGRLGRLAHASPPPRGPSGAADLEKLLNNMVSHLRTKTMGCTVIRTDPSGTPVVRLVALSPCAYAGMCGNSTWVERRRGNMLLWRDVGVMLADRGILPGDPQAQQPEQISVLGY